MEILRQHQATYDALAGEYEARVESLRPVTVHAVEILKTYLEKGRVLDVGCGAGLAVQVLRENNFEAHGIDVSSRMVAVARQRNSPETIIEGDFITHNFEGVYDGIFSFAFIHLYPKPIAENILHKMNELLRPGGVIYIGTTESSVSSEGFEIKADYENSEQQRFRKHWTREEFGEVLDESGFIILDVEIIEDPFGKTWMDFIATRPVQ